MISTTSKYAIRAVLYLAAYSNGKRLLANDLARHNNVSPSYMAKILLDLSRHGLISSVRGRHGGFFLTAENRETTLLQIVEVIDGEHRLEACMLSLKECDNENPCPLHNLVGEAKVSLVGRLKQTTVAQLGMEIKAGRATLPLLFDMLKQ